MSMNIWRMSRTHFEFAKKISTSSNHPQHKLGAVLVYKKGVVGWGTNNVLKTHPLMKKFSEFKTMHAELAAILKIRNKTILPFCDLYVFRQTKDGKPAMARPCSTCQSIIKLFGIKKVHYTTNNGWAKEQIV